MSPLPASSASAVDDTRRDPLSHLPRPALNQFAALLTFRPSPRTTTTTTPTTSTTTPATTTATGTTIRIPPRTNKPTAKRPLRKGTAALPEAWLAHQRSTIATAFLAGDDETNPLLASSPRLVASLARGAVSRLVRTLGVGGGVGTSRGGAGAGGPQNADGGVLCPAHGRLNAELVAFCVEMVRVEIGVRCDVLRAWVGRLDKLGGGSASPSPPLSEGRGERMRALVGVLSGVASLFLEHEEFERYFGWVDVECRFEKVESGCPACVLAVVGGREEVLVALRANMRARAKGKQPRLLKLVDAWMDMTGHGECAEMRAESNVLAAEAAEVRRWLHARKIGKRRGLPAGVLGEVRGKSKHRGGLPARAEVVRGMPMPQVRLQQQQHDDDGRHGGSYQEGSRPIGGLDGADYLEPSPPASSGNEDNWSNASLSRPVSPLTEYDGNSDGEYVHPRKHWHRGDSDDQGTPKAVSRPRPETSSRTVRAPLNQPSVAADSQSSPSQRSTVTNWGDLYT